MFSLNEVNFNNALIALLAMKGGSLGGKKATHTVKPSNFPLHSVKRWHNRSKSCQYSYRCNNCTLFISVLITYCTIIEVVGVNGATGSLQSHKQDSVLSWRTRHKVAGGTHDCFNCFSQHLKSLFEVCDKTVVIVIQIKQCVWRTQLDFVFAGFREVVGSWSFTLLI